LEKFHILCKNYSNKDDLKEQLLEFEKKIMKIVFIDTPLEFLVNTVNEIKEALGRTLSDNPEIFRDKFFYKEN
jgi:hypothetical protein